MQVSHHLIIMKSFQAYQFIYKTFRALEIFFLGPSVNSNNNTFPLGLAKYKEKDLSLSNIVRLNNNSDLYETISPLSISANGYSHTILVIISFNGLDIKIPHHLKDVQKIYLSPKHLEESYTMLQAFTHNIPHHIVFILYSLSAIPLKVEFENNIDIKKYSYQDHYGEIINKIIRLIKNKNMAVILYEPTDLLSNKCIKYLQRLIK